MQTEHTEYSLIRGDLFVSLFSYGGADAARQNPVLVGHGGDNPRDQLIVQGENFVGAKGTLESFRPKVSAGHCIDQLHSQANRISRLADAAFHHIASAKFLADKANIS